MSGLEDLTLARPWCLLALIPAVLSLILSRSRGGGLAQWRRAADAQLLAAMEALGRVVPGQAARAWAPALVAATLAFALTGPTVKGDDSPAFRNLDGLLLAMDLSPSVAETGALDRVRTAARRVAAARGTRPVAVIAFAGDAYFAIPFTTDERLISQAIAALGVGVIPDPGTRPGRALTLALEAVRDAYLIHADVVLIGDGGGIDEAALDAASSLSRIASLSVVNVQAEAGEAGDSAAVARLAYAGGGLAVPARAMGPLLERLDGSAAASDAALGTLGRRDLGHLLIALSLVPAIFLFRRRA